MGVYTVIKEKGLLILRKGYPSLGFYINILMKGPSWRDRGVLKKLSRGPIFFLSIGPHKSAHLAAGLKTPWKSKILLIQVGGGEPP